MSPRRGRRRTSVWTGITTIVVAPLLIDLVGAHHSAWLTSEQAPDQEVRGQRAVEDAEDARLAGRPPVGTRVEPLWEDEVDGWSWVFDRAFHPEEIAELGALADRHVSDGDTSADEQVRARGGTRWSGFCTDECWTATRHEVVLTGQRREPVAVVRLRARVVERLPGPSGTLLTGSPQGADPLERVVAYLDRGEGDLRSYDQRTGIDQPFLHTHNLTLDEDEEQGFEVVALTEDCRCRWELVVTTSYRGKTEDVVVRSDGTADGAPFETVGTGAAQFGRVVDGERLGGSFTYAFEGHWVPATQ